MTSHNSLLNVYSMFMKKIDNSLGQSGQRVGRAKSKFYRKSNFFVKNFFHIFWVFLMRWFRIWRLECLKTPLYFAFLYFFDDFDAWRRFWPLTRAFWSTFSNHQIQNQSTKNLKMWKKIFDEKIPGRLFGPADPKKLSILFINMQ